MSQVPWKAKVKAKAKYTHIWTHTRAHTETHTQNVHTYGHTHQHAHTETHRHKCSDTNINTHTQLPNLLWIACIPWIYQDENNPFCFESLSGVVSLMKCTTETVSRFG